MGIDCVLQCVTVCCKCCSVLQFVAVCCTVLCVLEGEDIYPEWVSTATISTLARPMCCLALCVAVCCVCCSVLKCVAECCVCCSVLCVLQCEDNYPSQTHTSLFSMLPCVAVCCNVLQCVAVCCSVFYSVLCVLQCEDIYPRPPRLV